MREPDNIRAIEGLDLDWMGFIFYPQSKRYVSDDDVIIRSIRQSKKKKVGVFVNEETSEILEKAKLYHLDMLQLHGKESIAQCQILKDSQFQIIKAFSIETKEDLKNVSNYEDVVDNFLFDTKCEGHGGSGRHFDWSILHAYQGNIPFLLSGGISPDSISGLLQFQHPKMLGIDVNSGFEIAPALKDAGKIQEFIKQIIKGERNKVKGGRITNG